MRVVSSPSPGTYEINWQWLPTFLGLNQALQQEIVEALSPQLVGLPADEHTLDLAHDLVVEFLEAKLPAIEGLREHLDNLKFVRYRSDAEQKSS